MHFGNACAAASGGDELFDVGRADGELCKLIYFLKRRRNLLLLRDVCPLPGLSSGAAHDCRAVSLSRVGCVLLESGGGGGGGGI
jgi:hypothetical protein